MLNYSYIERLLHRLILNTPWVSEIIFDLEKFTTKTKVKQPNALYVTGLARSGTTMLMRALYSTDDYASLTYRDMPFVLSPNLWARLATLHSKNITLQERAHGDGIRIDFDSPEAFEEVFWRMHYGNIYINENVLKVHDVTKKVLLELNKYHELVCSKYSKSKYLAKNNNLMLRMGSISKQEPSIVFLVMFRNPINQAKSLLSQHKNFSNSESFIQDYMHWLAHYEFGDMHRPFQFDKSNSYDNPVDTIDYWLQRWIDAYTHLLQLLKKNQSNIIPISYEKICNNSDYRDRLFKKLSFKKIGSTFKKSDFVTNSHANDTLVKKAMNLYNEIDSFSESCIDAI
jgi:hypothetical protein